MENFIMDGSGWTYMNLLAHCSTTTGGTSQLCVPTDRNQKKAPSKVYVILSPIESECIQGSRFSYQFIRNMGDKSAWMVQLAERLTPSFSSDHDPRVPRSSPASGSALSMELAWDRLSLSLLLPLSPCTRSLSNK